MKTIKNLEWTPAWTSIVGCIHGGLKYMQIAPDLDWLFGATGHGLIINMSKDGSCPSGPTAWRTDRFFELGKNMGYEVDLIFAEKNQAGFQESQREAWAAVKKAIDNDQPVVGWELAIPEWYLVNGYDQTGYYFSGPGADQGPSPKPWDELGVSEIGMLEIFSLAPASSVSAEEVIRDALEFGLEFNQGSEKWVLPDYRAGLDAYEVWIEAVRSGQAMLMGHAYNAAVWEECRRGALGFLKSAKKKLPGRADESLENAINAYAEVAGQLRNLTELYPFFENNREEPIGDNSKSQKAADILQGAHNAEKIGLDHLSEVLKRLS